MGGYQHLRPGNHPSQLTQDNCFAKTNKKRKVGKEEVEEKEEEVEEKEEEVEEEVKDEEKEEEKEDETEAEE